MAAHASTFCTCALRPSKPRRRSVTPAAIQTLVPTGSWITCADSPGSNRTRDESAPLSTLITARPGSSMWIAPPAGRAASPVSSALVSGARHRNRDQRHTRLAQFATFKCTTPLEHLVRVHTMCSRHFGHAGARLQCQAPPCLTGFSTISRSFSSAARSIRIHAGITSGWASPRVIQNVFGSSSIRFTAGVGWKSFLGSRG